MAGVGLATITAAAKPLGLDAFTRTVHAQPDLVVTKIILPTSIVEGQAVRFAAVVENQGSAATPSGVIIGVAFAVDGREVTWSDHATTSLAPGASRILRANNGPSGARWVATTGRHKIEATVNDLHRFKESNETNNSLTAEISVGGTAATGLVASANSPAPGTKAISAGFAWQNTLNAMSTAALAAALAQVASVGTRWLRFDYMWTGSGPGTTRYGATDTIISQAIAAGINVMVIFDDATNGPSATNGFCGTWMTEAVSHLSSLGVHTYEVQNEMNLGSNWSSGSANPGAYVDTLRAAYRTIHAADAEAVVLHCGLAPYGAPTGRSQAGDYNPFDFFTAMYAAGAKGSFDAANFHAYSYPDLPNENYPWNTFFNLPQAHATMVGHGDGAKKVWVTEFGVATGTDAGYSPSNVATQSAQADVVTIGYQMMRGWSWAGPAFFFCWMNSTGDGDFGLVTATGAKKASYSTFAAVPAPT